MAVVYPGSSRKSVTVTSKPDIDRGAGGDWRALKAGLKGVTEKAKAKRKKLKPFVPKS